MRATPRALLAAKLTEIDSLVDVETSMNKEWAALNAEHEKLAHKNKRTLRTCARSQKFEIETRLEAIEARKTEMRAQAAAHTFKWSALREESRSIARKLKPRPGSARVRVDFHYMGSYRSVGPQYDKEILLLRVEELRETGIVVEAVTDQKGAYTGEIIGFVESERIDPFIAAEYHREETLKEYVRRILKRGLNVRAVVPGLPYGIEAKLGLDYFGNDLQQKASS